MRKFRLSLGSICSLQSKEQSTFDSRQAWKGTSRVTQGHSAISTVQMQKKITNANESQPANHHHRARGCGTGCYDRSDTRQPTTAIWEETEARCRLSAKLPCPAVGAHSRGSETIAIRALFRVRSRLVEQITPESGADAGAGRLGMEVLRTRGLSANSRIVFYK
jgi:hypothetical protein